MSITPEELVEERTSLVAECWKDVRLFSGVSELVNAFEMSGIPICIATCSRKLQFKQKCQRHRNLEAQFQHIVTGSEIEKAKPDLDIFLKALVQLNQIRAVEWLVPEVASVGVKRAVHPGMPVVLLPEKAPSAERAPAILVIQSLLNFNFDIFD
jgi:beta-phosphoglucomutase-like phosphatase (HAD superfamily)